MSEFRKLQTCLIPVNYNLHLKLDIKNDKIIGEVEIFCIKNQDKSTNLIVELNSKNVKISSCKYQNEIDIYSTLIEEPDHERIRFTLPELQTQDTKPTEQHSLKLTFSTNFKNDLSGFYRSFSDDHSVKASSLFCPTEARTCFPCFDEPAYKATFDASLTIEDHDECETVLSNSPLLSCTQNDQSKTKTYLFDTTPKMSSYLLTFVIGNLDFYESTSSSGIIVRCYTPKGQSSYGKFAVDVAVKSLDFYEDYFDMPYPVTSTKLQNNFKKLDMVPLKECSVGAMENWGIITYRESKILYDQVKSSFSDKQTIASIVAHEIAHQWFGNLTTMDWWTEIWLNEGFATFCQYFCVDRILPEIKLMDEFMTTCLSMAFNLDKLPSSHPIEITINNPTEIAQVFDAISYKKGASIIRMMYNWIGDENFKNGLGNYFKKFAYHVCSKGQFNFCISSSVLKYNQKNTLKNWETQLGKLKEIFPLYFAGNILQTKDCNRPYNALHYLFSIFLLIHICIAHIKT